MPHHKLPACNLSGLTQVAGVIFWHASCWSALNCWLVWFLLRRTLGLLRILPLLHHVNWCGFVPSSTALLGPRSPSTVRIIRSGSEGGGLPEDFGFNVMPSRTSYYPFNFVAASRFWLRLSAHRGSSGSCSSENLFTVPELAIQFFRNFFIRWW